MQVLHLIKSLGRGGAEMLLQETLKVHNQEAFTFHYAYFLPWKNQLVSALQANGGRVVNFKAVNQLAMLLQVVSIIRYVKKNNIQIIHCHLPWGGLIGRLVGCFVATPIIYTEHNKQERYHWLTAWLNKYSFNWQHCVVAVSSSVATSIRQHIPLRIPVHTIPNGVATSNFVKNEAEKKRIHQQLGIPANAVVVGIVSVFRTQKRLVEWVQIFVNVAKIHPHLHAIIVGDGPCKNEIDAAIEAANIPHKIHLVGLQTDVKPYLSSMDIFMMTSAFEGLPIALLEAMSMGCAIIATDAGGIPEVVRHQTDGLLVPVQDYFLLVPLLQQLVQHPEQIDYWGHQARQRVINQFDIITTTSKIESLYHTLVK